MRVFAALALALFFCGCMGHTEYVEKYVCPDASIVDDPKLCAQIQNTACPPCPTLETLPTADAGPRISDCQRHGCPRGMMYVASKNSDLFHTCGCRHAERIMEKNMVCYPSKEAAESDGRRFSGC